MRYQQSDAEREGDSTQQRIMRRHIEGFDARRNARFCEEGCSVWALLIGLTCSRGCSHYVNLDFTRGKETDCRSYTHSK